LDRLISQGGIKWTLNEFLYSWECEKYAKVALFTKGFLGDRLD
jgi:hypothetical protein